jgi:hypothetical protein
MKSLGSFKYRMTLSASIDHFTSFLFLSFCFLIVLTVNLGSLNKRGKSRHTSLVSDF